MEIRVHHCAERGGGGRRQVRWMRAAAAEATPAAAAAAAAAAVAFPVAAGQAACAPTLHIAALLPAGRLKPLQQQRPDPAPPPRCAVLT